MKLPFLILSLIISISVNAQKGDFFYSSWHQEERSELNIPSDGYSYFKKGNLYYFLSNDKENIYLGIKVEDAGVQTRILKEGLTVWVDMDGKSARKMGIRFPIGSQNPAGRNRSDRLESKLNADGSLVTPLSLANTIELIGFINEEARRFPAENAENFSGSVKYDNDGVLHYKLIMPIAKLPVRNSKDGNGAMPFALGIQYGIVPEMNASRGTMAQPPSSAPPSGGSRGGSRSGARPGVAQNTGRPATSQATGNPSKPPVLFWIKNIKLATDK